MHCWRGPDGIQVDVIVLDQRPRLRITQRVNGIRYTLGYYSNPRELQIHVALEDLVEVITFPSRPHDA